MLGHDAVFPVITKTSSTHSPHKESSGWWQCLTSAILVFQCHSKALCYTDEKKSGFFVCFRSNNWAVCTAQTSCGWRFVRYAVLTFSLTNQLNTSPKTYQTIQGFFSDVYTPKKWDNSISVFVLFFLFTGPLNSQSEALPSLLCTDRPVQSLPLWQYPASWAKWPGDVFIYLVRARGSFCKTLRFSFYWRATHFSYLDGNNTASSVKSR